MVVVEENTGKRLVTYGVLAMLFLVVIVGGVIAALSRGPGAIIGTGIGLAVFFAILLATVIKTAAHALRQPDRLEVTPSHIRLLAATDREGVHAQMDRSAGAGVRFVTVGAGRASTSGLEQPATGSALSLRWFAEQNVRQACESMGWRVAD